MGTRLTCHRESLLEQGYTATATTIAILHLRGARGCNLTPMAAHARLSVGSRGSRERYTAMRSPTSSVAEDEPLLPQTSAIPVYVTSQQGGEDSPTAVNLPFSRLRRRCTCRQFCYSRIPKGKASLLVFVLNIIETFAFYGAVDGIVHLLLGKHDQTTKSLVYTISLLLQHTAGRIMYPLTGFLADVYLGRYRMIHVSLWLLWISFALVALSFSLHDLSHFPSVLTHYVLPIAGFVFISVGSAGFEATIIPFGVDQIPQGASSDEMSSYFYWYYAARQLGGLTGIVVAIGLFFPAYGPYSSSLEYQHIEFHTVNSFHTVFPIVLISLAIVFHVCFKGCYSRDEKWENPVKLITKVLIYAVRTKRQQPKENRAFRYGEGRKPRVELAKKEYDGDFTSEEVEDVKTFCRIVLVLFSLIGYFTSYAAAFVMLSYQVSTMIYDVVTKSDGDSRFRNYVLPTVYTILDELIVLLFLPVLNHLVIPCFPLMSIKTRLGFGAFINCAAVGAAACLQGITQDLSTSSEHKLLGYLVPVSLLALAELLVFVSGLEFIYAQSPESMKGLLTGLFYFIFGLCSGGTAFFFYCYVPTCDKVQAVLDSILWYYVMYAIIAFLGFVAYSVVAGLYINRRRPAPNEDDNDMRTVYQTVQY